MFDTEGMKAVMENHQQNLFNLYQQLFLCIRARACGWQLLLAFPGTEEISKAVNKILLNHFQCQMLMANW
jgi:hypothetical protein